MSCLVLFPLKMQIKLQEKQVIVHLETSYIKTAGSLIKRLLPQL